MTGRRGSTKRAERGGRAFDAFDLVLRQATLVGTADVASMPRAMDRLAVDETADGTAGGGAEVSWRITGATDGLGRPALEIELRGSVPLECQRCLQAFAWSVAQDTTLLLARDERELAVLDESDDTREVVLAAAPLDAATLIEDEVLLALPFAPRCGEPACEQRALAAQGPGIPRASAFAALAGLKKDAGKAKS